MNYEEVERKGSKKSALWRCKPIKTSKNTKKNKGNDGQKIIKDEKA